ncbi:MAG: hypothetical protein LIO91_03495 [Bacteroidales bacterium]|nr:hypothetical protein [Bacteroidales bacterium]
MATTTITDEQWKAMLDDFIEWLQDYDFDARVADVYERPGAKPWVTVDMTNPEGAYIATYEYLPEYGDWFEEDYIELTAEQCIDVMNAIDIAEDEFRSERESYEETDYDWWMAERANGNPYISW